MSAAPRAAFSLCVTFVSFAPGTPWTCNSLIFLSCVASHSVTMLCFIYPFPCRGVAGPFQVLAIGVRCSEGLVGQADPAGQWDCGSRRTRSFYIAERCQLFFKANFFALRLCSPL